MFCFLLISTSRILLNSHEKNIDITVIVIIDEHFLDVSCYRQEGVLSRDVVRIFQDGVLVRHAVIYVVFHC